MKPINTLTGKPKISKVYQRKARMTKRIYYTVLKEWNMSNNDRKRNHKPLTRINTIREWKLKG